MNLDKPYTIRQHFTCDGTGVLCATCSESAAACGCEVGTDGAPCTDCDGAGRICVEHESPCGDLTDPPRCDAAKRAQPRPATTAPVKPFRPFTPAPCKQCPFRKTAMPGWLGAAPPEMFIANIHAEVPSPCHMTIDYRKPDWEAKWTAGKLGKLCTGTLVMAANMLKRARNQRMIPSVPADRETVFTTAQEFLAHHNGARCRSWELK